DIDRTYYNVDPHYVSLLSEISPEVMDVTFQISDKALQYLGLDLNNSFGLALADHIQFALDRAKKGLVIRNPMMNEIQHMYEKEMKLGKWALSVIEEKFQIALPRSEAGNLVVHFLDAELFNQKLQEERDMERVIDDITAIVEKNMNIIIDREEFNYSRFVTHLKYMLKRTKPSQEAKSDNVKMYEKVREEYPGLENVIKQISSYFDIHFGYVPNDEELLYLMLHINRLCSKEL
ncbi:MAG: PRD domain-containing protein, partial [Holdemanella sp.]|nr:PRD domain-containing protein [Holdemanella sp.]